MAKLYNFHIYNQETETSEFENAKIRIANELGSKVTSQLKQTFKNDEIAIANMIELPGESGGGGDYGVFPLMTWFGVGLSVLVILSGKGFFDELGRDLAKRLFSVLFDKKRSTELTVVMEEKIIVIIIPKNTDLKNLTTLENFIKKIDNNTKEGKYIFSSEAKILIKVE